MTHLWKGHPEIHPSTDVILVQPKEFQVKKLRGSFFAGVILEFVVASEQGPTSARYLKEGEYISNPEQEGREYKNRKRCLRQFSSSEIRRTTS